MTPPHRILIVDDERDYLSSMHRSLRKESYQVITTDNGIDALRILEQTRIHLILSDYMMPDMDGLTFLANVRDNYPDIMTIMLTALSEIELAMKAVNEVGIYKFFLKPVEINSLKLDIRRALESIDLMAERSTLLKKIKTRDAVFQDLEKKYPGITHVKRDENGCYLMEE